MSDEKLISEKDVEHVADLARLALSESEKKQFTGELNSILGYVKEIEEVQIDNYQKFDHYNLQENKLRKDELNEVSDEEKEAIREIFPQREGNSLKVKEVLGSKNK